MELSEDRNRQPSPSYLPRVALIINPRRACAERVTVVIVVTVVVPRVCVCVPVRSFCRHVHLDTQNIGKLTYMFTAARKTLLYITRKRYSVGLADSAARGIVAR